MVRTTRQSAGKIGFIKSASSSSSSAFRDRDEYADWLLEKYGTEDKQKARMIMYRSYTSDSEFEWVVDSDNKCYTAEEHLEMRRQQFETDPVLHANAMRAFDKHFGGHGGMNGGMVQTILSDSSFGRALKKKKPRLFYERIRSKDGKLDIRVGEVVGVSPPDQSQEVDKRSSSRRQPKPMGLPQWICRYVLLLSFDGSFG